MSGRQFVNSSSQQEIALNTKLIYTPVNALGILLNFLLLTYLLYNPGVTSKLPLLLFRLQAWIDFSVCTAALLYQLQDWNYLPLSGWRPLDVFLCNVAYTGMLFWALFLWSVFNLCLIACERFIAVCMPMRYKFLKMHSIIAGIGVCMCVSILVSVPWCLPTMLIDGVCDPAIQGDYVINRWRLFFTVQFHLWFFVGFAFPLLAMAIFYGLILRELRSKRRACTTFSSAARRFTSVMLTASVVFVITQAFPNLLWFLDGALHVLDAGMQQYFTESASINVLVYLLTAVNSLANPFIYFGTHLKRRLCDRPSGTSTAASAGAGASRASTAVQRRSKANTNGNDNGAVIFTTHL